MESILSILQSLSLVMMGSHLQETVQVVVMHRELGIHNLQHAKVILFVLSKLILSVSQTRNSPTLLKIIVVRNFLLPLEKLTIKHQLNHTSSDNFIINN